MYNLGGFDLIEGGFIPIIQQESNIALSGFVDMPPRLGKTFHEWANEDGVEPYVLAEEIFFGGRDLRLHLMVTGSDQYECNSKVDALYSYLDSLTGLVPLVTDWATYHVYVNDAIAGEFMPDAGPVKGIELEIPMRQPVIPITGVIPEATNSEFGIDGISFFDLGGEYIELSGDRRSRSAPKSEKARAYGKEPYLITKRVAGELKFSICIKQPTFAGMLEKVANLMALFAAPGVRNLTVNNDKLRSFFVKDGFRATKIYRTDEWSFCLIECILTETGTPGTFTDLIDVLGEIVTSNEGDVIMVRI